MKNRAVLALIVAALAVVGILAYLWSEKGSTPLVQDTKQAQEQTGMEKPPEDSAMPEKNMEKPAMADAMEEKAQAGAYKDYSESQVKNEQTAGNKVVLFFHAPWCPFCKAADAAFKANAGQIPANVTVLKTDYDSSTALRQKYGITYQHTFVQIDGQGNAISRWSGGDIDNLKKYLK